MDQEYKYIEMASRDYFFKLFNYNLENLTFRIKCEKKIIY